MPNFDTMTIMAMFFFINCVSSCIVFYIWRRNRYKFEGLVFLFLNFTLQASATPLLMLRGLIPDFVSIVVANTMYIIGTVLFAYGVSLFLHKKFYMLPNIIIIFIFTTLMIYNVQTSELLWIRTIYINITGIILDIEIIWIVFGKPISENQKSLRSIGYVFISVIIFDICRIGDTFFTRNQNDFFKGWLLNEIFLIAYSLIIICLTFSILISLNNCLIIESQKVSNDIEELKNKFEKLASVDSLTGLLSRMKIDETLSAEIVRFNRYQRTFSIMLLDIDFFKEINDSYGHLKGDKILVDVTKLLTANVRETDAVGRWGGDEFLIVVPDSDIGATKVLAEKLRKSIAENPSLSEAFVSVSIGVANIIPGETINEIVSRADRALYSAKAGGRNLVVCD